MKLAEQILLSNKTWANKKLKADKAYFKNLSLGQSPKFLWFGCSDSRVPETEITGSEPGDFFVHRNIANQVNSADKSVMSVLKYAVDYLKIENIIVCGHTNCGGVKAAIDDLQDEHLTNWIADIKDTLDKNVEHINKIDDSNEQLRTLVELNVMKQVENLCGFDIVKNAWTRGQKLTIQGWIFDLSTGELSTLKEISSDNLP